MAIDMSRKFVLEAATELDKFEAIFQWGDSREKIGDLLRALLDERDRLRSTLKIMDDAMDMQEKRQSGAFHLSATAASHIWNDARDAARKELSHD